MNMYAFMYVGLLLEELIGGRRMFVSYLLTGLCSAAFSLYMHGETISAGASGSHLRTLRYIPCIPPLSSHRQRNNERHC